MSAEAPSKIPRPVQMRGMLHSQIKKNLGLVFLSVFGTFCYMRFVYGDGHKRDHAEFYKKYDIEKEFDRMRRKGLFDSCDTE